MSLSSALSNLNDASAAYAYENDRPARGAGGGRSRGGRSKGGGGGGGGGGEGDARTVSVSKKMSFLLRHGAAKEGVKIDEGGWVNVQDLLNWRSMKSMKVTFTEIQSVVATNNKKRFELEPVPEPAASEETEPTPLPETTPDVESSDMPASASVAALHISSSSPSAKSQSALPSTSPSDFRIRAVQGHSLPVASEALLEALDPKEASTPRYVMHGTTPAAWAKIRASGGLSRMGRGHVHTAIGTGDEAGDRRVWKLIEGEAPLFTDDEEMESEQAVPSAVNQPSPNQPEPEAESEKGASSAFASAAAATAPGPDGAAPVVVIAGRRPSRTVLVWINVRASAAAGLRWWRSRNGVVLSEGDERGMIPLKFVEIVELRRKIVQGSGKNQGRKPLDDWERVVIWRDGEERRP